MADPLPVAEFDSGDAPKGPLLRPNPLAVLLQEVLLRTDGTVTDMLELFTREEIRIEKLNPGIFAAECDWPGSCVDPKRDVRDVILCGSATGLRYVFAHTHLFPEAIAPAVRTGLTETSNPIGKVLIAHQVETFRQIEQRGCRPMPAVSGVLGGAVTDRLHWRRYSVISGGSVIMEITEAFREYLFDPSAEPA